MDLGKVQQHVRVVVRGQHFHLRDAQAREVCVMFMNGMCVAVKVSMCVDECTFIDEGPRG